METDRVCQRPRCPTFLIILCLLATMLGVTRICVRGHEHADAGHPEAAMIRTELARLIDGDRAFEASNFKVCWSPLWGSLMISFKKDVYECAAVYKVTIIHNDIVELTPVIPRERTAFCKTGNYWDRVRLRDMYVCLQVGNPFYNVFLDMLR